MTPPNRSQRVTPAAARPQPLPRAAAAAAVLEYMLPLLLLLLLLPCALLPARAAVASAAVGGWAEPHAHSSAAGGHVFETDGLQYTPAGRRGRGASETHPPPRAVDVVQNGG